MSSKKQGSKAKSSEMHKEAPKTGRLIAFCLLACAALLAVAGFSWFVVSHGGQARIRAYQEKLGRLRGSALTDEVRAELPDDPAGEQAGYAVFLSICNTEERASVFTGTGANLDAAWNDADRQVRSFLKENRYDPKWVKADLVYSSEAVTESELAERVWAARSEFFRYGVAFDAEYGTALLEAEMNGAKIYDYDSEDTPVDFQYLNLYLKKAGRSELEALPETYLLFQCKGWFCDEDGQVFPLYSDGLEYGRRAVDQIDADYARELMLDAGQFLVDQVKPDGSFVYGMYPRFDNDIEGYNIVRHSSTIWSLICLWRITGDKELVEVLERTIDHMLSQVVYSGEDTAYLYEESADEIKLGGCGVAVIALTEYMDAFGNDRYADVCRALGRGILTLLDQQTGEYYHVLNGDFSRKEEFRTVYYDGEATFALCRLYGLTGEEQWLTAARAAVDHFIEADYTQYKDHWVAYSMNEITKYVDDAAYYDFGLKNVQENLKSIYRRDTTYHTYLELLMASYELYSRMVEKGIRTDYLEQSFSLTELLKTIYARADRMLNGFFYPEYAMYMRNPGRILRTFMVRHDGYRVRIDDVQHNIGGFYKYYTNYEKMVADGLLEAREYPEAD